MFDLAVLGLLRKRPRHGYELKARLVALGFSRVSFGTLYPALRRLEKKGFIEALRQSGRRKAYRLTTAGQEEFARILDARCIRARGVALARRIYGFASLARLASPAPRTRDLRRNS